MLKGLSKLVSTHGKHSLEYTDGKNPETAAATLLPPHSQKVALLFDAENISLKYLSTAIYCAKKHGELTVKRAYGTGSTLGKQYWDQVAKRTGTARVMCNGHVAGKNSVDINIVIDAMKMALTHSVDVFVIVASDSDYSPLAHELKAQGYRVYGMASNDKSGFFAQACTGFTDLDKGFGVFAPDTAETIPCGCSVADIIAKYVRRYEKAAGGWCPMCKIGEGLLDEIPALSFKRYGCKTLTQFVEEMGPFEVKKTAANSWARIKVA